MKKKTLKIYFNAPITLSFVGICLIALALNSVTNGESNYVVFSTFGSSWFNPMTYVRLVCHVFGHADLSHLLSNMMYILLLGPMLEEKYGNRLCIVILVTAVVTGVVHNIIQPNVFLLGASGVVFAFILLTSITGTQDGIPVTLIFVAILWLGNELLSGMGFDNISQITHIIGGLSGASLGLIFKDR